jgi:hypothetical protein
VRRSGTRLVSRASKLECCAVGVDLDPPQSTDEDDSGTRDLKVGRDERLRLIRLIEHRRSSRVITYVCGDRLPIEKDMIDDDVRALYDHLNAIAPSAPIAKIDLFLYSNGGDVDVPWRLVSVIREHAKEFAVLIPYRAYSSATMVVLGADEIVATRKAELGPIDAAVSFDAIVDGTPVRRTYRVEDAMAYVRFLLERVKLKDPDQLARALGPLTAEVGAVELGELYRTQRHTQSVAELLMGCRNTPPSASKVKKTIETLSKRIYTHSHSLSRRDVIGLGLPVVPADPVVEGWMWQLFEQYERALRLREPIFKDELLDRNTSERRVDHTAGVIESETILDEYIGTYRVYRDHRARPAEWTIAPVINVDLSPLAAAGSAPAPDIEEIITKAAERATLAAKSEVEEIIGGGELNEEWINDSWQRTVGGN